MAAHNGPTVKQLSRESEEARADLVRSVTVLNDKITETVDDLKFRLSPRHVKAEVKTYIRQEGEHVLSTIERKARQNPLQTVAIGAAVIYPFWGLLRAIPMPALLIGGGLWLSTQKSSKIAQTAADSAGDVAKSVHDVKESLSKSVASASESVSDTVSTLKDTATDFLDSARNKADDAAAVIKETAEQVAEDASASAAALGETSKRVLSQSRTVFDDLIDRNPLFVGGLALAVGAAIAASLPRTPIEDSLFGESSNEIKDKALATVSQGVERAKNVASDVVNDIAAAAADEGLTKEGLSETIKGVQGAVKAVVDKGLTTALGASGMSQPLDVSQNDPSDNGDRT